VYCVWQVVKTSTFIFNNPVYPNCDHDRYSRIGCFEGWNDEIITFSLYDNRKTELRSNIYPTRCTFTQFIYIWKLLYMLRVLLPPIIRSSYNFIYSIWYLSDRYCYRQIAVTVWQIPEAVDTVVCAPDDGWRHHPKHVELFPDINKLFKFASCWIYILEYIWDARTHEHQIY
jgi:hypothetical protein